MANFWTSSLHNRIIELIELVRQSDPSTTRLLCQLHAQAASGSLSPTQLGLLDRIESRFRGQLSAYTGG